MGCTFGDKGFFNPASNKNLQNSPKMGAIPEKSESFQENILLSFYNWPKVETSAVLKASIEGREHKQPPTTLPF
jgi:hypothetical protein